MEEEFLESDFIFPENLFSEEEPVVFQGHWNSRYFTSTNPILMKRSKKKDSKPTIPINITPENVTGGDSCIQSAETDFFDDHVDDQLVPPHAILGRRISDRKMAFPVVTGNGRTLKGRDLCQFRNSVLRMTGFLEGNVTPQQFLRKNQGLFEGQQWEPTIVFEKAKVAWKEYSAACELTKPKGRPSSISLPSVWQPPPLGCLKINVGGALDSQNGFGSVGLIARTSSGAIVEARMIRFKGSFSPRVIEGMGFRFAVTTAMERNWNQIIVEGDALQIVNALNQTCSYVDCEAIVFDCLRLVSNFSSCHFSYVNRLCNRVAHRLARSSLQGSGTMDWRDNFPQWLSSLALEDVRALAPSTI